jgi:hypothetical protein
MLEACLVVDEVKFILVKASSFVFSLLGLLSKMKKKVFLSSSSFDTFHFISNNKSA